jgi:dTMP kinase
MTAEQIEREKNEEPTPRMQDGAPSEEEIFRRAVRTSLNDLKREDLGGALIVIEGADGSGRSTVIALLTEWLESLGFAVQTIGLRRSNLLAKNIDKVMARNVAGRLTLSLMYATDFFDQLENIMIPALRSNYVVLADRYIHTLIARACVRGISYNYVRGIYSLALKPDLTFWLNTSPDVAFSREFKKSGGITYWESGRDLYLSDDLYNSFVRYQTLMRSEFRRLGREEGFIELDGEASIRTVNAQIRKQVAKRLGIKTIRYKPSTALARLWL